MQSGQMGSEFVALDDEQSESYLRPEVGFGEQVHRVSEFGGLNLVKTPFLGTSVRW